MKLNEHFSEKILITILLQIHEIGGHFVTIFMEFFFCRNFLLISSTSRCWKKAGKKMNKVEYSFFFLQNFRHVVFSCQFFEST